MNLPVLEPPKHSTLWISLWSSQHFLVSINKGQSAMPSSLIYFNLCIHSTDMSLVYFCGQFIWSGFCNEQAFFITEPNLKMETLFVWSISRRIYINLETRDTNWLKPGRETEKEYVHRVRIWILPHLPLPSWELLIYYFPSLPTYAISDIIYTGWLWYFRFCTLPFSSADAVTFLLIQIAFLLLQLTPI